MGDLVGRGILLPRVTEVRPLPAYNLLLTFDNGEHREFDTRTLRNSYLYRDITRLFTMVRVSHGTVEWPGGLDVCPDMLYRESVYISERDIMLEFMKDDAAYLQAIWGR